MIIETSAAVKTFQKSLKYQTAGPAMVSAAVLL